jgi:hypothetical protein
VLSEFSGERWTVGLFSGAQPEPLGLDLAWEIVEHGAYVEWRSGSPSVPAATRRTTIDVGAVASYEDGSLNRDFLFVQSDYRDERLTAYTAHEIDVNYGWKRDVGEPALSVTSTYASVRFALMPALALHAGYDNRRSVRLHRDRSSPAAEFDDRYRQGAWSGADAELGEHLRLGGDIRLHGTLGAAAEDGHSWSVRGDLVRLLPLRARVGARFSHFAADRSASRLATGMLAFDPHAALHLELGGGSRTTSDRIAGLEEGEHWLNAEGDLNLGRRFLVGAGIERDVTADEARLEESLSLSYRF